MNSNRATLVRAGGPILGLTIVGVLSTVAFQILVIRELGPSSFGVLAAFLALINIASVGSSAVRNSVAVGAARMDLQRPGRQDRTLLESVTYGLGFTAIVGVLLLTGAYESQVAGVLVLAAVVPYFVFARAQGLMQGNQRVLRVLGWSTGAQLLQLALAVVAVNAGAGWMGILASTALVAVVGALASSVDGYRLRLASTVRPFQRQTVVALLITILFTWLISMDVAWVKMFASGRQAGEYAAVTTVIKMAFLVPTTLSLYLLPRFARNLEDRQYQVRTVQWSALVTLVAGLLLSCFVTLVPQLFTWLLGESYAAAENIAPAVAVAFLPWVVAQVLVTQLTARGSAAAVYTLFAAGVIQFLFASIVLPNIQFWILCQAMIGLIVFLILTIAFVKSTKSNGMQGLQSVQSAE